MYLHLAHGIRRPAVFCTEEVVAAITHQFYNNVSFLQRCLRFPRQLYLFSKSYFRGYRASETEGSLYDIVCNIPRKGYFAILLELPTSRAYRVMEKNG